MSLIIEQSDPSAPEAIELLNLLSATLHRRFSSDGRGSFQHWEDAATGWVFLLARRAGRPVGCGALRPIDADTGEIKRMFALTGGQGIGTAVLRCLLQEAKKAGFKRLWLETRAANIEALAFYGREGFAVRDNYGAYVGRPECVCLERDLDRFGN